MKRVGLILLGAIMVATIMAPVGVSISRVGLAMHPNVALAADPFKGSGGPVCVAVPIFSSGLTPCKDGGYEIPNDEASGGAIIFYLKLVLKLINSIVGGVIILVLVIAGIQYITSLG